MRWPSDTEHDVSVWDEDIFTEDNLYHALGGAAVTGVVVFPGIFFPWTLGITVPLALYAWGYAREVAQSENDWTAPLRSFHKCMEAASWGIASTIVAVPAVLVRFL